MIQVTRHTSPAIFLAAAVSATLLDTPTPQLGWNSYNFFNCYPSEAIILENAKGLVDHGLAKAGYEYLTVDCGWPAPERDEDGRMVWNPYLFPSGVEALRDEIHGLGLKFGVYSGGGYGQCGNGSLPASLGYEAIDAASFAEWGADSLKYDNCFATNGSVMVDYHDPEYGSPERFRDMAGEIDGVDRDILYQVCQWGCGTDLGEWAPPIGNSYRISNDIYNHWRSIWRIANQVVPYADHTGPGSFPDMDMLIVGLDVLTEEEERFHMGLWSMAKSPLTIGLPLNATSSPSRSSLATLTNKDVLAINQDPLAKPARLVRRFTEEEWDLWAGPLSRDRMVVALANWRNGSQSVSIDLARAIGVSSAHAKDVWAGRSIGSVKGVYETDLDPHQLQILILSKIKPSALKPVGTGYHSASTAALTGSAILSPCTQGECLPAGAKVTDIASNSTVRFSSVQAPSADTQILAVDFINYDVAMGSAWEWGSNTRNMTIAVNDGVAKRWAFPLSGGDWFESGRLLVEVDGFEEGEGNSVVFAGSKGDGDAWAPELVGFELLEYQ